MHALRYYVSFETYRYSHSMRMEIWQKDYEGEPSPMVLSGEPTLKLENGGNICGTSLDFGLHSQTDGQYLDLYTTDNHKYLIKLLRDGAVVWEGYLLPEYYSEAYIAPPYTVNFTATDWLGMLKNVDFPAQDERVPILKVIKTCLEYTELPLDFAYQLNLAVEGLEDGSNLLGMLHINPITFTGYNCYEVLEKILSSLNATLRQMGHYWLIAAEDDEEPMRIISWDTLQYLRPESNNNGELISSDLSGTFIEGSLVMSISPAKKSVQVSQDIFYRESWLKDYDFKSADAWSWPANQKVTKPGYAYYLEDGVLKQQILVDYLIVGANRGPGEWTPPYIYQTLNVEGQPNDDEFCLAIQFLTPKAIGADSLTALTIQVINRANSGEIAYLSKEGWTNEESTIDLLGTAAEEQYKSAKQFLRNGRQEFIYDKENWPTTKINFVSIPYTGTLEVRLIFHDLNIFGDVYYTYLGGVYLTKTNITKNITISASLNPDAAETAPNADLMLCDTPEERNTELGVLNYFSLPDGATTIGRKWYCNGQEFQDYLHAIAYSYARTYANRRQVLSGAIYTDKIYKLWSFRDKWSAKNHLVKSYSYGIKYECVRSMEIVESPVKEIQAEWSVPESGSNNKVNQPSGGTGGGGTSSMAGSGRYVNLDTAQEVAGEKTWKDEQFFKKNINVEGDAIVGGEVVVIAGEAQPAGVTDYSQLKGKPKINGKELSSGNNTLAELGIQPAGDYATKSALDAITALIPSTATSSNQLADKAFVNSSISTATAEFRGTFTSLAELKATSGDANDYAFYQHKDELGNTQYDRYKWTSSGWVYEYTLNNSSFTAAQWSAINSGITEAKVSSYDSHLSDAVKHITASERTAWNAKWDYNAETIKGVKVNAALLSDKATLLATSRLINGTSFNGSADITTTQWGDFRTIHISDATGTNTGEGKRINGSEDFTLKLPAIIKADLQGNAATATNATNATSATKLQTARTLWGQPFDGTGNVSGALSGVTGITASGTILVQGDFAFSGETIGKHPFAVINTNNSYYAGGFDATYPNQPTIYWNSVISAGVRNSTNDKATINFGYRGQGSGNNFLGLGFYGNDNIITILAKQYVGIGTTNPSYKLDVKGTGHFSSKLTTDDDIICGGEVVAVAGEAGVAGVSDYAQLTGKPMVNGVELLSGNNTLAQLGIQPAGSYAAAEHTHSWSVITGKPTLLPNPYALSFGSKTYNGSAAVSLTASDIISDIDTIRGNAANGNTAYGWGNHSLAGYLTGITKTQVENVLTGNITSHTHSYLPLSGGTMQGSIKFNDSSLPGKDLLYICGIDAFANGGEMGWQRASEFVNKYSPSLTGTGASGNWGINITGNAATATNATNAATATKLATARTIWGQSFDGSANVGGNLSLYTSALIWLNDSDKYSIQIKDDGIAYYKSYYGHRIYSGGYTRLTITTEGNVGIGTTSPAYKLDVAGKGHFASKLSVDDDIICGGEVVVVAGEAGVAGVSDYGQLTGKPKINGVELLSGNNTLAQLGIQQAGSYAAAEHTHSWSVITGKPTFAAVATSGSYNDLSNKPTIPTTTSQISEGSNLYFTNARAVSALSDTLAGYQPLIADLTTIRGNAANGNTAYGWGNHSLAGYLTGITKAQVEGVLIGDITSHTHSFASLTSKPTTLAGYGITDAYTKTEINNALSGYLLLSGGTMTGSITMNGMDTNLIRNITYYGTTGWAKDLITLKVDNVRKFAFSAFGSYTSGATDNGITFAYLGMDVYNGTNLRIYGTGTNSIKWGNNNLLHAGNYNSYAPSLTGAGASGTWGISISGNAATATKLATARTIWGQSFDGSANVSGALTGVTTISASGAITTSGSINAASGTITGDLVVGGEVVAIAS